MRVLPVILMVLFCLTACSNGNPKITKSPDSQTAPKTDLGNDPSGNTKTTNQVTDNKIPVQNEKNKLSGRQNAADDILKSSLILFQEVEGAFPQNLNSFTDSGFPIIWPANVFTGGPVHNTDTANIPLSEDSLGEIYYSKANDERASLEHVVYDLEEFVRSNQDTWKIQKIEFPDDSLDADTVIYINGGIFTVKEVNDYARRRLYAQFGQLAYLIVSQSSAYYLKNNSFPDSFDDLFDEKFLFIRENMEIFTSALNTESVEFKWGYDIPLNTCYIYLSIDGKKMIEYCVRYGDPQTEKTPYYHDCDISNLDMSNPIIDTSSLKNLSIPDKYAVALSEITGD
jgi:hypothetical protein